MQNDSYKKALIFLPKLLNITGSLEESFKEIFQTLKNVIDFENAFLFYLNADYANLQYKTGKNAAPQKIKLTKKTTNKIYDSESFCFDGKSEMSKEFAFAGGTFFAVIPLKIQSAVFGFIIIARNEKAFSGEDLEILRAFGGICAYAVKDSELTDVLKMQFEILQKDVEEKSTAYKSIEEENQKMLEADKIKNEFIANVSHELRTPLNAIIGFSEILKSPVLGGLNEKQTKCINDIHASSIHLLGMINEVLDISKIEANAAKLNPSDIDFLRLITETGNIVKPLSEKKHIKISIQSAAKSTYFGDYQKIQQILFNLLSNAIKFTPENGEIEITANEDLDNFYLSVKDNGIGIPAKYHGKIFAKFVQLENDSLKKESSTGLGLTITKELVNLHQGKISVESKVGKGTKFTISLPKTRKD